MKHLPSLILFLLSSSILSATTGLIDDYYLGFSYSYTKFEKDYSENGPSIASNFAVHPNISIGAGLAYRNGKAKARTLIYEGEQITDQFDNNIWLGNLGILLHNKFEPSEILAIYPFIGLGIAAQSIDLKGSLTDKLGTYPLEASWDQYLYSLSLGTQFLINDFFVLTPVLSFVDYMDDDGARVGSSFG